MLVCAGAAASVLVTAALRASLGAQGLPVLSIPFIVAFQLVLGAAVATGVHGVASHAPDPSPIAAMLPVPAGIALFLRSLGGLFFVPRVDAGALVFAALLYHSRIAASLAASAFTAVLLFSGHFPAHPEGVSVEVLGYNAMLAAVALGGVFFVPSTTSFLLALLGASVSTLLAFGLAAPFARIGVPMLILPFNAAVVLVLFALRQRARDGRPKAVDFLSGTPEENLAYYRTRRSRFQQLYPIAFQLPVRGTWTCTQATDGEFTHKGPWRHAVDLEVRDEDGHLSREGGATNEDFHCFRLPVLAAAEGTVVAVEGNVSDNAVGAVDVERNWGNHVLVQHGAGLYSLVAHLAKGSVKVRPGQFVRRGEVVGSCGSSGRSPRPHLHFQLQGAPALGAPTLPCDFTDVVEIDAGARTAVASLAPEEGARVRNLEPDAEVASFLGLALGRRYGFAAGGAEERVAAEVDLYGRYVLASRTREASLFYGWSENFFTAYDVIGDERSVLHLLRAALPRVPLEASEAIVWTNHLPARNFRPWLGRVLFDLLSPFLARDGIEMELRMRREGARLVVEGASRRKDRRGAPIVKTRAELTRGVGPTRVVVTVRGRTRSAELTGSGFEDFQMLTTAKDGGRS